MRCSLDLPVNLTYNAHLHKKKKREIMDIGALFILLALTILVAMYLAQPYMERRAKIVSVEELELSALFAKRDNAIDALKELEFDNTLGKIPEEDYLAQKAALMQNGAEAMRRIDEYQSDDVEKDDLEAAIASRRAGSVVSSNEDNLESMIAARRSKRKAKSGGFCPNCGHPILGNDKFCTNCGKRT